MVTTGDELLKLALREDGEVDRQVLAQVWCAWRVTILSGDT